MPSKKHFMRFQHPDLDSIMACATGSRAVADLAETFPLVFHALAAGRGPVDLRQRVLSLVEAGRPLPKVAAVLGLPTVFRRVLPEAIGEKLPWFEFSPAFGRRIANSMPESAADQAAWLPLVMHAACYGGEEFAVWIGRKQHLARLRTLNPADLLVLGLFAWHSQDRGSALNWLAPKPWHNRMLITNAIVQAKYWLNRVKLMGFFARHPIADTWMKGGSFKGYEFVPLTDFWQLMEERTDMGHCIDCYANKLARDFCRVFGIRQNGRKIATLEIGPARDQRFSVVIVQVKGPLNREVSCQTLDAARGWARREGHIRARPILEQPSLERQVAFSDLFAPYRAQLLEGLPDCPPVTFDPMELDSQLARLAAHHDLCGWPFGRRGVF